MIDYNKQYKFYLIYKTTCIINQKFYIGMHCTNNIDDGYKGSGKRLMYSIKKYGLDNHNTEILELCNDIKDLKLREKEIVNIDLLNDPFCLNLCTGGHGGFNPFTIIVKDKNDNHFTVYPNDPRYLSGELVNVQKGRLPAKDINGIRFTVDINDPRYLTGELVHLWLGRKHKEETKKKISVKCSIAQCGDKNSQFGKCWIHHLDLKQSKSIKKEQLDQYLTDGWIKGRKVKFNT